MMKFYVKNDGKFFLAEMSGRQLICQVEHDWWKLYCQQHMLLMTTVTPVMLLVIWFMSEI